MSAGDPSDVYSYGRARVVGGLLCIIVGVALPLIDSLRGIHTADSIVIGLILGTGVVLLGVEAGRKLLDRVG